MTEPPLAFRAPPRAASPTSTADYSAAIRTLEKTIRKVMSEWDIGVVAVALVDDQQLVYAAGFGEAKRDSIFRVGSVSKLFNAIGVMRQVEAGRLDLDAPIAEEWLPLNPFSGEAAVTLRQILCHRSGLQRESTVGGYFDHAQPGLAATVASLRACVLVTRPGEKTRYSNLAPSLAGRLVERATGQAFEDDQREHILGPLGMTSSAWTLSRVARDRLVASHMRVADGRGGWTRRISPLFDLGTIPAGNLFSSAEDLARFASALLADGGGLVKPETLLEMWRPQFTTDDTGFGLGFMAGKFRERRAVSHGGAVYGYSSSFVLLLREKLAVIVLANEDVSNGPVHHISDTALSLLLQAKLGVEPPAAPKLCQPSNLAEFAGDYESQSYWARVDARDDSLAADISGQPTRFNPTAELTFAARSRIEDGTLAVFERDSAAAVNGFQFGVQHFTRVRPNPPSIHEEWRQWLGAYGPDFIPLVVSERHGHLYAMTENMVDYRLTPLNRNVCLLPPGMYMDEQLVFLTGAGGRSHSVNFANMLLSRRTQPPL
jgi:CubicO group peptidase (beta-lactamase class C family)